MRRFATPVLLGLSLVLTFLALISTWVREEALNTDQWVDTSTQIIEQKSVQEATAAFLAQQLESPQATERLRQVLPNRTKLLANPLQGVASEAAERAALRLLATSQFQTIWRTSNRVAHRQFVEAVTKESGSTVVLDLRPMLGRLAERTGFGITPEVERRAVITVLDSSELGEVRGYVKLLNAIAWWTAALALLSLAAAIWLAGDRRRAVVNAGIGLLVVGLLVLVARRAGINHATDALAADTGNDQATRDTLTIATRLLQDMSRAVVALGVLAIAGAWSLGPSRWATKLRELLRPAYANYPFAVHAAVAIFVLLIVFNGLLPWSTSPLAIVVYLALGATLVEMLRRADPPATETATE